MVWHPERQRLLEMLAKTKTVERISKQSNAAFRTQVLIAVFIEYQIMRIVNPDTALGSIGDVGERNEKETESRYTQCG